MNVIVIINDVDELVETQTTSMLIVSLVRSGRAVRLLPVDEFTEEVTEASQFRFVEVDSNKVASPLDLQNFVRNGPSWNAAKIELDDTVLIRTNPGRDPKRTHAHDRVLSVCQRLQDGGNTVINSPANLKAMASKKAILILPECFRPPMLIDESIQRLASFIRDSNTVCVTKPLVGSRGQNVCRVLHDSADLESFLQRTYSGETIVAQHFVESSEPGDKRVVVVDGEVLQLDGKPAGIHRIPNQNDFRANLHAGATAAPLQLSESQWEAAEQSARLLQERGIRLAGVDLIGDKVIEFNVFSTGGLYFANRFAGVDFADEVVQRLLNSPE